MRKNGKTGSRNTSANNAIATNVYAGKTTLCASTRRGPVLVRLPPPPPVLIEVVEVVEVGEGSPDRFPVIRGLVNERFSFASGAPFRGKLLNA